MQDSLLKTELGGQDVNHLASIKRLLDTISSPATITNGDNIFIYANQAFLDYYKYKLADIIGVSPRILQPLKGSKNPIVNLSKLLSPSIAHGQASFRISIPARISVQFIFVLSHSDPCQPCGRLVFWALAPP